MSSDNPTSRFSVTMGDQEVEEIRAYTDASGVPRNELIRRATLAYVRLETGKGKDIKTLFRQVGSIDLGEGQPIRRLES